MAKKKKKTKKKAGKRAKKAAKKKTKKFSESRVNILASYVRDLHKSGYSRDEIKDSLRKNGASAALISAVMRKARSGKALRPRTTVLKSKKGRRKSAPKPKKKKKKKKKAGLFAKKKKKPIIKKTKKKKAPIFKVKKPKSKKTFRRKKVKPVLIIMIIALIIIAGVGVLAMPKDCGRDLSCFMEEANKCSNAKYLAEMDNAEVKFTTHGCKLEKEIVNVDRDEPKDVRDMFTGMSMICRYDKGEFSTQYTDRIAGGVDTCSGSLADAVEVLQKAKNT